MELLFKNPVFKSGRNLTVRRGIKWDIADKQNVLIIDTDDPIREDGQPKVLHVVDILETRVMRFIDLEDSDLQDEHDPVCRTYEGLLNVMEKTYPGFDQREIVTLVWFEIWANREQPSGITG